MVDPLGEKRHDRTEQRDHPLERLRQEQHREIRSEPRSAARRSRSSSGTPRAPSSSFPSGAAHFGCTISPVSMPATQDGIMSRATSVCTTGDFLLYDLSTERSLHQRRTACNEVLGEGGRVGCHRDARCRRAGVRADARHGAARRSPRQPCRGTGREAGVQSGRRKVPRGMPAGEAHHQARHEVEAGARPTRHPRRTRRHDRPSGGEFRATRRPARNSTSSRYARALPARGRSLRPCRRGDCPDPRSGWQAATR